MLRRTDNSGSYALHKSAMGVFSVPVPSPFLLLLSLLFALARAIKITGLPANARYLPGMSQPRGENQL